MVLTEVGDALLQFLLEDEGEEVAGHVTTNGLVDFVKDRPRREQALGGAEGLLHHGKLLVAEHGIKRRKVGIGAQNEDAIELGILLGLGMIDDEAILAGRCEKAAIAGIADERLVAFLELPFERSQDCGAIGGVLLGLVVIAADDVAASSQRNRFGLVIDTLAALGDGQRHERCWIVEHKLAHQFVRTLAHTENVEEPACFKFSDRLSADHAAIRDNADATDGEPLAQPVDHRNETAHVGGVAGPHLRADRTPVAVEQDGKDHLVQIRPMILGEAVPAERLPAGAFEVQAGRVHEHEIKLGEQVAPLGAQLLFHHILETARRQGAAVLFGGRQFLAQPRHRPIEVMQVEPSTPSIR